MWFNLKIVSHALSYCVSVRSQFLKYIAVDMFPSFSDSLKLLAHSWHVHDYLTNGFKHWEVDKISGILGRMNLFWEKLQLDVLLLNLWESVELTVKLLYLFAVSNAECLMYITFVRPELPIVWRSTTEFVHQFMKTKENIRANHLSLTLDEVCIWEWKVIKKNACLQT